MFSLQDLLNNSTNYDAYIIKNGADPKDFKNTKEKFIYLVKVGLSEDKISKDEVQLASSKYFNDSVFSSCSLYEICLKVFNGTISEIKDSIKTFKSGETSDDEIIFKIEFLDHLNLKFALYTSNNQIPSYMQNSITSSPSVRKCGIKNPYRSPNSLTSTPARKKSQTNINYQTPFCITRSPSYTSNINSVVDIREELKGFRFPEFDEIGGDEKKFLSEEMKTLRQKSLSGSDGS
uniref:Uncharacterized protein n=1 Tax=viral metagenome TaxID=1070528 RepID=A0A6C0BCV6_9ZZZZ